MLCLKSRFLSSAIPDSVRGSPCFHLQQHKLTHAHFETEVASPRGSGKNKNYRVRDLDCAKDRPRAMESNRINYYRKAVFAWLFPLIFGCKRSQAVIFTSNQEL